MNDPETPASLAGLFATDIHRVSLASVRGWKSLRSDLISSAEMLAIEDRAGQAWCWDNGYDGYTSYSTLDDLPRRASCFGDLVKLLQREADAFASALEFDLRGRRLELDNIWINMLAPGGSHSGHIHPHCVLSGTCYLAVPDGASSIRFEDPRLALMMAAPLPRRDCSPARRRFVHVAPQEGDVLIWESWLRHEVSVNRAKSARISVSFNYRWA